MLHGRVFAFATALLMLGQFASAQSEAHQVMCNAAGSNVTVVNLGGVNATGLLCGYSLRGALTYTGTGLMNCYDSVQNILAVASSSVDYQQLPARGIVFHDYLICTPPPPTGNPNPPYGSACAFDSSAGRNVSYIVYVGTPGVFGPRC